MKIIILLLISINGFSQPNKSQYIDFYSCKNKCDTSIERIDGYVIEFIYNPDSWMDDLVGRMKCDSLCTTERYVAGLCKCEIIENPKHYYATVRVYKNKKQIGDVMTGYYMKGQTCWDADPAAYLRQAQKTAAE